MSGASASMHNIGQQALLDEGAEQCNQVIRLKLMWVPIVRIF